MRYKLLYICKQRFMNKRMGLWSQSLRLNYAKYVTEKVLQKRFVIFNFTQQLLRFIAAFEMSKLDYWYNCCFSKAWSSSLVKRSDSVRIPRAFM